MSNFYRLLQLMLIIPVISFSQILTDFDTDSLENWRSEGDGNYYLEKDMGNPGNCMRVNDDATGDQNIAIAPLKFIGNWSVTDTTDSIFADIFVSRIGGNLTPNLWLFRISGPGGMATSPVVTPVLDQWNHFSFSLDSSKWNISAGTWRDLVDYVYHVEVLAEFVYGDEYVRLDNIGLTFTPLVIPLGVPVSSNFDKGTYEGWTFQSIGGISLPNTGGNPAGYCQISDGSGIISQAIAPPKFLGDWSQLENKANLQLDLRVTGFSGPLLLGEFLWQISGPGGTAIIAMDSSIQDAFNQWKSFAFEINESAWEVKTGSWSALIKNITELRLICEYISGSETVSLDNIKITDSPPVADFFAEPTYIFPGESVQFYDRSQNAPNEWLWSFGDGESSIEMDPVHTYEEPGFFNISLKSSNNFGNDTETKEAYIQVASIEDSILFEDNFDDNSIHPAWRFNRGSWVESSGFMVQNSNDYVKELGYLGGCYAFVGSRYWQNYRLNVDFRSTDDDKIGVVFNYQDEQNFYLFTWQKQGAVRALKKFIDGVEENIFVDDSVYVTNIWYHLEIISYDSKITCRIDSSEIFSISDSTFLTGKAGLYCHGNLSSFWDNFKITNLDFVNTIQVNNSENIVSQFQLYQNYPNPFNPSTIISWQLAVGSKVELSVYNILGEKIAILVSEYLNQGTHKFEFNGQNLPSGIYFYQLIAGEFIEVRKMLLLQ